MKGAKWGKAETERRKIHAKNCEKTTGNKVRSKYEQGSWEDKKKHGKKNRGIGNCGEDYSRSKTGRRKLIVEDWIRKINGAKCGKFEIERRKIYVKNYEKTAGNKAKSKYKEGSWRNKKTRKEEQRNWKLLRKLW